MLLFYLWTRLNLILLLSYAAQILHSKHLYPTLATPIPLLLHYPFTIVLQTVSILTRSGPQHTCAMNMNKVKQGFHLCYDKAIENQAVCLAASTGRIRQILNKIRGKWQVGCFLVAKWFQILSMKVRGEWRMFVNHNYLDFIFNPDDILSAGASFLIHSVSLIYPPLCLQSFICRKELLVVETGDKNKY